MQAARTPTAVVRYRNRELTESDLGFIRGLIEEQPSRTRHAVAEALCDAWAWRQSNGKRSEAASYDLLLRLEEWGHIQLPARQMRAASRRRWPLLPVDLIPIAWVEVREPDGGLGALEVRPIGPEEHEGWRIHMQRYHYLGYRPPIGEHLEYAAFLDNELVALIGWAAAALRAPHREEFIGWDDETKRRRLHLVTNNTRFLIPPWVRVKNLASKVLAMNVRRLSADWQRAFGHAVLLAETFVDTARFAGTCYRAANWQHLGQTAGRTKRGDAYLRGGTPKALFVYELRRNARRALCNPTQSAGTSGATDLSR